MKNPFFENWLKPESSGGPFSVPGLPFDLKGAMEIGRKQIQAIGDAQQVSMEGIQTAIQRQSEIFSDLIRDQSAIVREMMGAGSPEDKIAQGADLVRKSYEKTVCGVREVEDIVAKSSREASDIISRRVASSLGEIKASAGAGGRAAKPSSGEGKSRAA